MLGVLIFIGRVAYSAYRTSYFTTIVKIGDNKFRVTLLLPAMLCLIWCIGTVVTVLRLPYFLSTNGFHLTRVNLLRQVLPEIAQILITSGWPT